MNTTILAGQGSFITVLLAKLNREDGSRQPSCSPIILCKSNLDDMPILSVYGYLNEGVPLMCFRENSPYVYRILLTTCIMFTYVVDVNVYTNIYSKRSWHLLDLNEFSRLGESER